jgi:hypothetical protein
LEKYRTTKPIALTRSTASGFSFGNVMCAKKRPNCACQLPDLSHTIQGYQ